jgi:hypothetical protein
MVYTSPSSPHIKLFEQFLQKKRALALDAWGVDDAPVKSIYDPLEELIKKNVQKKEDLEMYPYATRFGRRVATYVHIFPLILIVHYVLIAGWDDTFWLQSIFCRNGQDTFKESRMRNWINSLEVFSLRTVYKGKSLMNLSGKQLTCCKLSRIL